jgi:hypothetical protein
LGDTKLVASTRLAKPLADERADEAQLVPVAERSPRSFCSPSRGETSYIEACSGHAGEAAAADEADQADEAGAPTVPERRV